jgi:hypothetical protein
LQMLALNINKPITTIPHEHGKLNNWNIFGGKQAK